jgi:hypothetical protein
VSKNYKNKLKKYPKKIGVCKHCNEDIIAKYGAMNKKKRTFCSHSCRTSWQNTNTPKTERQIQSIKSIGQLRKGIKESLSTRLAKSQALSGVNHWNWQGGSTEKNRKERNSLQARMWKRAVWERDNWTCQCCGDRSGNGHTVFLEAHHIKTWCLYPELRYEVTNGITMCKHCHKKTDNFGYKAKINKR